MASVEAYQARVDDYNSADESDGGHVINENFPRKSSPTAQANVSTKRSKDLSEKGPVLEKMPTNIDLRSDSGYSSFTAASKSSADSAPSATSRSPPVLPATAAPPVSQSPALKTRRPTVGGEARQHSNESSPRQTPLSRTASVSSKQQRPAQPRRQTVTRERRDTKGEECRDPNCTDCGFNTLPPRHRRPELQQTASTRHVPGHPSETMSQRSDPNPYYSPPSPIYNRQPAPYASQGPAVVQTARTRRSSSISRPRPQSFAGDPSAGFWVPGMPAPYPSPPQERGPPPSFSAYQNMPNMPNMQHMQNMQYPQHIPPYMGGQQGGYYPQQPQQFDGQQRPSLSARGSSNYGRSQPPPLITQEDTSKYSARYGQPPTPNDNHMRGAHPSLPKPKLLQYGEHDDDEDSESESSDEEPEYDEREARRRQQAARVLMPPPNLKRDQSQRRPPLAHAKTTQVVERLESDRREKRRQSIVVPDRAVPRERQRERERAPQVSAAPLRRASVSRPPAHRSTQSEYDTRQARVVVNDSRTNRRKSYQVYDKTYDDFVRSRAAEEQYNAEKKREKRASQRIIVQERHVPGQFEDDEESEEEEELEPVRILAPRQRRKTESDPRKGKATAEVKNRRTEHSAEEYINATRGSRDPYADQINKAALKKASRKPSLPSESGSSNSNGSGRASQSNRTTMTSATNNEIRLRVDGTMPLSLQLSGDMEGRTLQLVPVENGMTDLVIGGGNARSNESVYHSERGTVQVNNNRRSMIVGQGRRDAEDASERSSRSARSSRRDRDEIREVRDERGHILRRSRNTTYH
jgi:hypothetical protein